MSKQGCATISAIVWFLGLGGLGVEWFSTHGFDLTALLLGIVAVLPAWIFLASEIDVSLFGQKLHIKTREIEDAARKVAAVAPELISSSKEPLVSLRSDDDSSNIDILESYKRRGYLSATDDPNLALVGLRIEIERRMNVIAQAIGIEMRRPLSQKIQELSRRELLPSDLADALTTFVRLGNEAAHGAHVDSTATEEVRTAALSILPALDAVVKRVQTEQ